jgi:transposase
MHRFPRGQDVLSSCRLGKGAQASAGKRCGTAGAKSGTAYLPGAFAEAAGLVRRAHPGAQPYRARLEQKQGKACTVLAPTWARAVSARLPRAVACDPQPFFHGSWRGAGEPGASLDDHRISLPPALGNR